MNITAERARSSAIILLVTDCSFQQKFHKYLVFETTCEVTVFQMPFYYAPDLELVNLCQIREQLGVVDISHCQEE